MTLLWAALLGYALGSIPFGLVLSRLAGLGDIRAIGSGNIGATNVLRTGRKDVAAATLLLDGLKGAVAVAVMQHLAGQGPALLAGVAAVLGHCTSPWVGFKGGKGVATGIGVVLAWAWPVGAVVCAVWLIVAIITRLSSAAALAGVGVAPVAMLALRDEWSAAATLAVSLLIAVRHSANIARLRAGTEPRIGRT